MGALAWRFAFGPPADTPAAAAARMGVLAAAAVAFLSPHYPWYYAWLALPSCLAVRPSIVWLSVAPLLLYSDPWHDEILLPTAVFVPAALLALREAAQSRMAMTPLAERSL